MPLRNIFPELESPFVNEVFFADEVEARWRPQLTAVQDESQFFRALEQTPVLMEAETPGEQFGWELELHEAEKGIIGVDNRIQIRDTTGVPWRWICKITVSDNRGRLRETGTGVLVSERHVLTAAHVVHAKFVDPYGYSVQVTPALNGTAEPFGSYSLSKNPNIRAEYDPKSEDHFEWDYALLTLKVRAGALKFQALNGEALCYWGHPDCGTNAAFARIDPAGLNGKTVLTAGYPRKSGMNKMWCAAGLLHSAHAKRRTMSITADTTKGQSGSPVWIKEGNAYYFVGIAAGAGTHSNRVVRVTRGLIRQVRTWIAADGDKPAIQENEAVFQPEVDPEQVLEQTVPILRREVMQIEAETSAATDGCEPGKFKLNRMQIVCWRGRVTPERRNIPRAVKLAILCRGRIRLPLARIRWLVDAYKNSGWVKRLTGDLSKAVSLVDVTTDLFLNRKPELLPGEIDRSLSRYLQLRQKQYFQSCPYVLYQAVPAVRSKEYMDKLGLSLASLLARAAVPAPPRMSSTERKKYWLLIDVAFPESVSRLLEPAKTDAPETRPPAVTDKMPPLAGRILAGCYNLRREPSATSQFVGALVDTDLSVTVVDKARGDGQKMWYHVALADETDVLSRAVSDTSCDAPTKIGPTQKLRAGTSACFGLDEPLVRTASWDYFRNQLRVFENQHSALGLGERITRLRQMSHEKSLPFDRIIGTGAGTTYRDMLPYFGGHWQLFKDYQAVNAPDGRWVDLHHLFVGLDVLSRPEVSRYVAGTIYTGKNFAAATWAGDLGAGAADATLASDSWAKRNPKAGVEARAEFYFRTRAAPWDLLADIDAWGIHALRRSNPQIESVDKLLAMYYENTRRAGEGGEVLLLVIRREEGIERFLLHYGFQFDYKKLGDYPDTLHKQEKPRREMENEISAFGRAWTLKRLGMQIAYKGGKPLYPNRQYVSALTRLFLRWLERLAIENGAET